MEQHELFARLMNDHDLDREYLEALSDELEQEYAKPDAEKLRELSGAIYRLTGGDAPAEVPAEQFAAFEEQLHGERRRKIKRWRKVLAACASIAVVCLCANSVMMRANGSNYADVFHFTPGSVSVIYTPEDFGPTPVIEQSGDPYGILAQCKEIGIAPLVPTYLPDGYELELVDSCDNTAYTDCTFVCEKGWGTRMQKRVIALFYSRINYEIGDSPVEWGTSSSEHRAYQETICGYTVSFVIEEKDKQYDAFFLYNGVICHLFCQRIPPEEFRKILESMFA